MKTNDAKTEAGISSPKEDIGNPVERESAGSEQGGIEAAVTAKVRATADALS